MQSFEAQYEYSDRANQHDGPKKVSHYD